MEIGQRSAGLDLFVRRLAARSVISADERDAVMALPGTPRTLAQHVDFVRLGEEVHHACLVTEGVVARFAQLEDGGRQIIGLHIPGDMVDLYSLMLPRAPSPLRSLTPCTILRIPHEALRELAFEHHDLSSALWRDCVADGHVIAQWLVNVGRRNALARTAHLLCEMAVRFAQIGQVRDQTFSFSITQEYLADALGLTSVHVNRCLRTLRHDGLVQLTRKEAIIKDWEGLRIAGEFEPGYLHFPISPAHKDRISA